MLIPAPWPAGQNTKRRGIVSTAFCLYSTKLYVQKILHYMQE
ncbi:hypothetical protein DLM_1411 [Aquitalea magnusonii]|uniref:Uncharacterized protein n=1 Tax=Aquitalea magnusonii TaxID=332411 RepID=A0A3G9GC56_9NEIS|nr:hypothetical protein DLM_1411 [Aquitalea magnusonii]